MRSARSSIVNAFWPARLYSLRVRGLLTFRVNLQTLTSRSKFLLYCRLRSNVLTSNSVHCWGFWSCRLTFCTVAFCTVVFLQSVHTPQRQRKPDCEEFVFAFRRWAAARMWRRGSASRVAANRTVSSTRAHRSARPCTHSGIRRHRHTVTLLWWQLTNGSWYRCVTTRAGARFGGGGLEAKKFSKL